MGHSLTSEEMKIKNEQLNTCLFFLHFDLKLIKKQTDEFMKNKVCGSACLTENCQAKQYFLFR